MILIILILLFYKYSLSYNEWYPIKMIPGLMDRLTRAHVELKAFNELKLIQTKSTLHISCSSALLLISDFHTHTRTSQNIGSFLAKSTTRVMAGVIIFVNWLKASMSTLFPSGALTMDAWPISSGCNHKWKEQRLKNSLSGKYSCGSIKNEKHFFFSTKSFDICTLTSKTQNWPVRRFPE